MEMRRLLWEAFEYIAEDDAVRAVILTGAGGDFCAGIDVGEMGTGHIGPWPRFPPMRSPRAGT